MVRAREIIEGGSSTLSRTQIRKITVWMIWSHRDINKV
jgi:hypothetical protein